MPGIYIILDPQISDDADVIEGSHLGDSRYSGAIGKPSRHLSSLTRPRDIKTMFSARLWRMRGYRFLENGWWALLFLLLEGRSEATADRYCNT
jgi:hypothetical protein